MVVGALWGAGVLAEPAPKVVRLVPERSIGQSGSGPVEFRHPTALLATPAPGVLVVDTGNARVQHLSMVGELLWEAGGLGTEEGSLRRPTSAALATGLTYLVLDSLDGRVLEFHARGEFLGVGLVLEAVSERQVLGDIEPRALAVDRSGNAWIADRDGDRLLVFTPDWQFLYEVGGFGSGPLDFADPEAVAVTRDRVYVADSQNGRIQVLDPLGNAVDRWALPDTGVAAGVAVDPHGNVFVADAHLDRIVVFDPTGQVLATVGGSGTGLGAFQRPTGVCVADGRLVVAEADNDRLQVFHIDYE